MRQLLTYPCLFLLVPTVACQVGDEADLEAEAGPDAGMEDDGVEAEDDALRVTRTKLHLYADSHYQGTHHARISYDSDFSNDGFNDRASSLINDTPYFWLIHEHVQYGGRKACMRPDSRVVNLAYVTWSTGNWNDRISSVRRVGQTRATCGDNVPVIGTR